MLHKTNSLCSITVQAPKCVYKIRNIHSVLRQTMANFVLCQQHNKQQEILQQAVECTIVLPLYSDQSSPLRWSELLFLKQVWL